MKTMLAARMHEIGGPLLLEEIPIPEPRPTDVLVAVKASAAKAGVPYQRFIRQTLEAAVQQRRGRA